MNVRWSPGARIDYDNTLAYLLEEWGQEVVQEFADRTLDALNELEAAPQRYPLSDVFKDVRRYVLHANVSIYYRIHEHEVELLRFFGVRQHPDKRNL